MSDNIVNLGRDTFFGSYDKQSFATDGIASLFDLRNKVGSANQLLVVYNGVIQEPGVGKDYTISNGGNRILFSFIPTLGSNLYCIFLGVQLAIAKVDGSEPIYETATGDGIQTNFTLVHGPVEIASIIIFVNGIQKRPTTEFTISANIISFISPPANGALIDFYIHGIERIDFPGDSDDVNIFDNQSIGGIKTFTQTLQLKTHSAFPGSENKRYTVGLSTTDDLPHNLNLINVSPFCLGRFKVDICARRSDGTDKYYWCFIVGGVRRGISNSGNALLVGVPEITQDDQGNPGYSAYADVIGTQLRINVIGEFGQTVVWDATIEYQEIQAST